MRQFCKNLLIFVVLGMMTVSCITSDEALSRKPRKVAEKFLGYLYNGNYDKAKQIATSRSRQIIDIIDQLVTISGQNPLPAGSHPEISECVLRNDTAFCYYYIKGEKNRLDVIKVDGKWLADLKKETKPGTGGKRK